MGASQHPVRSVIGCGLIAILVIGGAFATFFIWHAAHEPQEEATEPTPAPHNTGPLSAQTALLGSMAYTVPVTMTQYRSERFELHIARTASNLHGGKIHPIGQGKVKTVQVALRNYMGADLYGGHDFGIDPLQSSHEYQEIADGGHAEWLWQVTPTSRGEGTLVLHVMATDALSNAPVEVVKKVTIHVKLNPAASMELFWFNNWQWLLGSSLAAFLAGLYGAARAIVAYFRNRRKQSPDEDLETWV